VLEQETGSSELSKASGDSRVVFSESFPAMWQAQQVDLALAEIAQFPHRAIE